MLSLRRCRQLLGAVGENLTDAQVEQMREELYGLARVVLCAPHVARGTGSPGPSTAWGLVTGVRREALEERAAILEYDGGLARDSAERLAFGQMRMGGEEN